MKALIFENKVIQIEEESFPISSTLSWVDDIPSDVEVGYSYENGKFENISDFINRVNPKDINKLQLEGLVRAGAFDKINSNRQRLLSGK